MNYKNKARYIIVVAITIDGFIARYPGHKSGTWTSKEDFAHLKKMENQCDVMLLSRGTYELAKKALSKRNCVVITTEVKSIEEENENLVYINPKKSSVAQYMKKMKYKKVCILGGRGAYSYCLKHNLVDEIYLSIEPIAFGKGITIFDESVPTKKFRLVSTKKLNKNGSLLLRYVKK